MFGFINFRKHAMRFAMKLMILQEVHAKRMETELELGRTAGVLEVIT